MIYRCTRSEMGRIWSDQGIFYRWLEVELAGTDTLVEASILPFTAPDDPYVFYDPSGFGGKRVSRRRLRNCS